MSIVYKAWMGLTGLFLTLFLVVHCLGNLQLFLPEALARPWFNAYAHALSENVVIKAAAWGTYASIVTHAAVAGVLGWRHRSVRTAYALERPESSSPWYARFMGTLGIVTLVFIVIHMQTFWYRYTWGDIGLDARGYKDLYTVVRVAFAQPWLVAVHALSMIALGFHLQQGVPAGVRSLGLFSQRLSAAIDRAARPFAWGLAIAFAAMPLYVYIVLERPTP